MGDKTSSPASHILSDVDGLVAAARACDGVIHTAFIHDFSAYEAAVATDMRDNYFSDR